MTNEIPYPQPAPVCRHARFTFATDDWNDAQCAGCRVKGRIQFAPEHEPARSAVESALLQSVEDLLAYAEDVLSNREQLACFKPGVVQKHVKAAHAAIEAAAANAPTAPQAVAWAIPKTGQFSFDPQDERWWTRLVAATGAQAWAPKPEPSPYLVRSAR